MVPRSKLCTFASLAFAFALSRGFRIDEASDALVHLLVNAEDIQIYNGLSAGFPAPVPDEEWRSRPDMEAKCFNERTDFIVESGFNSTWWDEDYQDNKYEAFACLIDKEAAMKAFDLQKIPDIDPTTFHGIPSRIARQLDKVHEFRSSRADTPSQPDNLTTTVQNALELNPNKSEKLAWLNQASSKFWGNADRNDRTTHPDNKEVEQWLIQHGFSETLANKAATIIRPGWAATGRKPEK
jgi:hypothetical protein